MLRIGRGRVRRQHRSRERFALDLAIDEHLEQMHRELERTREPSR
jgi:hypothetical protein